MLFIKNLQYGRSDPEAGGHGYQPLIFNRRLPAPVHESRGDGSESLTALKVATCSHSCGMNSKHLEFKDWDCSEKQNV